MLSLKRIDTPWILEIQEVPEITKEIIKAEILMIKIRSIVKMIMTLIVTKTRFVEVEDYTFWLLILLQCGGLCLSTTCC